VCALRFDVVRPNLEVDEVGPTLAFFTDVLGFGVVVEEGDPVSFAIVAGGPVSFAVVATPDAPTPRIPCAYVELDGVIELEQRCRHAGVDIAVPLTDRPWGLRDLVVRLPGGDQIAFGERIATSPS
jgi:hypothetical protein